MEGPTPVSALIHAATLVISGVVLMIRCSILFDNSENILKVLNDYSKNLDEIKTAIEKKDGEKLMKIFSSTKKVRKEIIKAGQDTEKPGFGRK